MDIDDDLFFVTLTGTGLSEYEIVWPKDLSEGSGPDGVHGTGLQIDQNGSRNILAASCEIP